MVDIRDIIRSRLDKSLPISANTSVDMYMPARRTIPMMAATRLKVILFVMDYTSS